MHSYYEELSTGKTILFLKFVFCKWTGSVYKLIWKEMIVFFGVFFLLQITYRFVMNAACQRIFVAMVQYASAYEDNTPIAFLLGFFVESVFDLWDQQWNFIPWPTTLAIQVSSSIRGFDEVGRAMRRTIVRYAILSRTLVFRVLSPKVLRRFPERKDLIPAGLINQDELNVLDFLDEKFPGTMKYWLPTVWAATLVSKAREEGRIKDDFALKALIETLNNFQDNCGALLCCAFVYIPLVQTQVVALAVYTYFLTGLFSHQCIIPDETSIAFDFMPIILILRYIFYMGWLKVAETMMNPYGDDDCDFDASGMTDAHLQMSYLIVDEMHADHPELLKDRFWNGIPRQLPDILRDDSSKIKPFLDDVFDIEDKDEDKAKIVTNTASNLSKPCSDIIDGRYSKIPNLESSQTLLAREMNKIRRRARRPNETISDDSDDPW